MLSKHGVLMEAFIIVVLCFVVFVINLLRIMIILAFIYRNVGSRCTVCG